MKPLRNGSTSYLKSVRSMTRDDIQSLREPSAVVRLQKLRDAHHIVARLDVCGLSVIDISAQTGYTPTRISQLRGVPAYQELLAKYRDMENSAWLKTRDATNEAMARIRMKSLAAIEEVFDEDEPPSLDRALKVFDSMADRTNYHRKTTKENINFNMAARLEAAIARSKRVITIEHEE